MTNLHDLSGQVTARALAALRGKIPSDLEEALAELAAKGTILDAKVIAAAVTRLTDQEQTSAD